MKNKKDKKQDKTKFDLKKFASENTELIVISFISGILVMLITITGFNIYEEKIELNRINSYKGKLLREQGYWKHLSENYPDYKDAFMQYALVSYELGDIENTRKALNSALKIDPDYTEARDLLSKL